MNISVILPVELITTEILLRLDVKSLMLLKCVSKPWNTLISDPIFVKMHLKLSKSKGNLRLALFSNKNLRLQIRSVGRGRSYTVTVAPTSVSLLLESTTSSIPLADDLQYQFSCVDCCGIIGSCNGLICLHGCFHGPGYKRHSFCFWNPATRSKSKTLLYVPSYLNRVRLGFGYDNSTDTYKTVMLGITMDEGLGGNRMRTAVVKVFTLGDSIWRDIQSSFPVELALRSRWDDIKYDGVYLSNSINWLVRHRYKCQQKNLTTEQFVIISLDLETETYAQLQLPKLPFDNPNICVLMDCICFSYDFKETHFVIWQMKEFGVEESWTQFLKISYQNLGINYIVGHDGFLVLPVCLFENVATLILAIKKGNQAVLYNLRDNKVKKIEKTNRIWWCVARDYVESLVSTC